jgi:NAD(P)H-hydrate epimerase
MIRLTRSQVREIDRQSIEEYKIPGIVLMENAARGAVTVAAEMLGGNISGEILILCGGGNNGGDGLAVARHLHNRGANVKILLAVDPSKYSGDAKINWEIIQAMSLPTAAAEIEAIEKCQPSLIIDAIFGTGLEKPPREPFGKIVEAVAKIKSSVLAIDLPSGMDADTGEPLGACIRANRTVTFVAEKAGFANPAASHYTGNTTVADIGCPKELIAKLCRLVPSPGTPGEG